MDRPRAIVFDLDGTLIDSRADIAAAVNHALAATGRSTLSDEAIGRLVGDGAKSLLARATALDERDAQLDKLLDHYMEHYLAHPVVRTTWLEGAREALIALHEAAVPVALCTNKARNIADRVIDALGARAWFGAMYGGGDGPEKKPSAAPLLRIAHELGVAPTSLVMVGDGPQDVLAGKAAGARTIGVLTGYQPPDRLLAAKPDVVLASMTELGAALDRLA